MLLLTLLGCTTSDLGTWSGTGDTGGRTRATNQGTNQGTDPNGAGRPNTDCGGTVFMGPAPGGATVVLEHDRCSCALVALDHSLPGVVLHLDPAVGRVDAEAVRGWTFVSVSGGTMGSETEVTDLAYDAPNDYAVVHAESGVGATFRASVSGDRNVTLHALSLTGCP